jgi:hypothetical protein
MLSFPEVIQFLLKELQLVFLLKVFWLCGFELLLQLFIILSELIILKLILTNLYLQIIHLLNFSLHLANLIFKFFLCFFHSLLNLFLNLPLKFFLLWFQQLFIMLVKFDEFRFMGNINKVLLHVAIIISKRVVSDVLKCLFGSDWTILFREVFFC